MARFRADRAGLERFYRSEELQRALAQFAERGKAYAEQIAPVRTGHYRDSFRVRTGVNRRGLAYARLENTAHYAIYLEYGTRYMARQRILGRSVDAMRG